MTEKEEVYFDDIKDIYSVNSNGEIDTDIAYLWYQEATDWAVLNGVDIQDDAMGCAVWGSNGKGFYKGEPYARISTWPHRFSHRPYARVYDIFKVAESIKKYKEKKGFSPERIVDGVKGYKKWNKPITIDGVHVMEYGEYPQMVASEKMNNQLEELFQSKSEKLKRTGKKYTGLDDWEYPNHEYAEYWYKGKKYVRVVCQDGTSLSSGEYLREGDPCWIKVEPIEWYIEKDKKTGEDLAWAAKKCLIPYIEYRDLLKFMCKTFSKEIIPSQSPERFLEKNKKGRLSITEILDKLNEMPASEERKEAKKMIVRMWRKNNPKNTDEKTNKKKTSLKSILAEKSTSEKSKVVTKKNLASNIKRPQSKKKAGCCRHCCRQK